MMTLPIIATCSLLLLLAASQGASGQTALLGGRQSWPGLFGHRTLINHPSVSSSSSSASLSTASRPGRSSLAYSSRFIDPAQADFLHHRPLPALSVPFAPLPLGFPLFRFRTVANRHTGHPVYPAQPYSGSSSTGHDLQPAPTLATSDTDAAPGLLPATPAPSSLALPQPARPASSSSAPTSSSLSPSSSANRVPVAGLNSISSSSRPATRLVPARLQHRRPSNSIQARPAPSAVVPLATSATSPASSAPGALGLTTPNDSDIGFDDQPASDSDSSSLASPTIPQPASSPRGSAAAPSGPASSNGFETWAAATF